MFRLGVLSCLLVVAACKKPKAGVGESCTANYQCDRYCVDGRCAGGTHGEPCKRDGHCNVGLQCWEARCLPEADAAAAEAARQQRAAKQQRKEAAEKEARLLKESGITEVPAEQAVHPPGPGPRVRIVTTKAKRSAFAACRADERLTGGGCESDGVVAGSYPSGHGAEDSVGARWNCKNSAMINTDAEITAYALCSPLAPR